MGGWSEKYGGNNIEDSMQKYGRNDWAPSRVALGGRCVRNHRSAGWNSGCRNFLLSGNQRYWQNGSHNNKAMPVAEMGTPQEQVLNKIKWQKAVNMRSKIMWHKKKNMKI